MILAALLVAQAALPASSEAEAATRAAAQLKGARASFEYGDYGLTAMALQPMLERAELGEPDRLEALKLLGLSQLYLKRDAEATQAFLQLLLLDPDYQLDPFYVPPPAVVFFEGVRQQNEALLGPLRAKRRADRASQALALEQTKRDVEARAQQRGVDVIERRFTQHRPYAVLLPFGLSQLDNGDLGMATFFGATQALAGLTSLTCYFAIEALRDPATSSTPRQFSANLKPIADGLDVAKWISAGAFYALWIASGVHAWNHYAPETLEAERTIRGDAPATPGAPQPAATSATIQASAPKSP